MKWFSSLTIGKKIWTLSGFLIASLVGTELFSHFLVNRLGRVLTDLNSVHMPAVRAQMTVDMMHDGLTGVVYRAIVAGDESDVEEVNTVMKDLDEVKETFKTSIAELETFNLNDEAKNTLKTVKPEIQNYTDQATQIIGFVQAGKVSEAKKQLPEFQKAFEKLEESLGSFGDTIQNGAKQIGDESLAFKAKADVTATVVGFLSVTFALILSFFLTREIMSRLRVAISGLKNESIQLGRASESSQKDSEALSSSSTEQSTAIQETAASLEEINAMLKRTSENAKNLTQSTQKSSDSAVDGQKSVNEVLEAMNTIKDSNQAIMTQVEESNKQITEIVKVISEIGNKTKVINDIVFQTKLLSFNASVEAARAGEHGKGFAVVAEEVGNLAQMSGNAAKEISDMLTGSIAKVESIVNDTKKNVQGLIADGKEKVERGVETAGRCGESLNEIVKQVDNVKVMVNDITVAISEQTQGINEISKAISQLDEATQLNAKLAEKASGEADRLVSRANAVSTIVVALENMVVSKNSEATKNEFVEDQILKPSENPIAEKKERPKKITQFEKVKAEKKLAKVTPKVTGDKTTEKIQEIKLKTANGDDFEVIPTADDPRFKDV
jgi:methyl-accepting chemotaxis protein